jgi:hypothetical protein
MNLITKNPTLIANFFIDVLNNAASHTTLNGNVTFELADSVRTWRIKDIFDTWKGGKTRWSVNDDGKILFTGDINCSGELSSARFSLTDVKINITQDLLPDHGRIFKIEATPIDDNEGYALTFEVIQTYTQPKTFAELMVDGSYFKTKPSTASKLVH